MILTKLANTIPEVGRGASLAVREQGVGRKREKMEANWRSTSHGWLGHTEDLGFILESLQRNWGGLSGRRY